MSSDSLFELQVGFDLIDVVNMAIVDDFVDNLAEVLDDYCESSNCSTRMNT